MATVPETTNSRIVCHCLRVTESEVRQAITEEGACSLQDVMCMTGAGTGCTACHCRIRALLSEQPAFSPVQSSLSQLNMAVAE